MLLTNKQISLIENWIKGLRSGKYKQGRGRMFDSRNNTYCCLGVECRVNGVPEEVFAFKSFGPWDTEINRDLNLGFSSSSLSLPDRALFAKMNDSEKYTFHDIANLLEYYLEVVRIEAEVEHEGYLFPPDMNLGITDRAYNV